jgi:hypothetical protein
MASRSFCPPLTKSLINDDCESERKPRDSVRSLYVGLKLMCILPSAPNRDRRFGPQLLHSMHCCKSLSGLNFTIIAHTDHSRP